MSIERGNTDSESDDDTDPTDTLAQYSPDEDEVLGTEEEREQIGNRSLEIINGMPPQVPMDFTPSSIGRSKIEVIEDVEEEKELHQPSERATIFKPNEGGGRINWGQLSQVDHTTAIDADTRALKNKQHRREDIDILVDRFDLDDTEQHFIETVCDETNLRDCGSVRYENLLLGAVKYVFRAKRQVTLEENTTFRHDEYGPRFVEIGETWDCDHVDVAYGHIREEYDEYW